MVWVVPVAAAQREAVAAVAAGGTAADRQQAHPPTPPAVPCFALLRLLCSSPSYKWLEKACTVTKPAGSPDRWLVTLTEVRQQLGSTSDLHLEGCADCRRAWHASVGRWLAAPTEGSWAAGSEVAAPTNAAGSSHGNSCRDNGSSSRSLVAVGARAPAQRLSEGRTFCRAPPTVGCAGRGAEVCGAPAASHGDANRVQFDLRSGAYA